MFQNRSALFFIMGSMVLITGLFISRFLISLGMISIIVSSLIDGNLASKTKAFFKNKAFLFFLLIFILHFISIFWSSDLPYFWDRINIKLPFLLLPFAFLSSHKLRPQDYKLILNYFVGCSLMAVFWSLGHFISDYQNYIEIYSKGQILPTPIQHIRFSIIIVLSVAILIYFRLNEWVLKYRQEKYIHYLLIIFFVAYLHLLAVRSGLLCLYAILAYLFLYIIISQKKYKLGIASLFGTLLLFIIAYSTIPTIKNKIDYTRYSISLFQKNEKIRDLSDSRRLGSIFAGLNITKENPILGCGLGDIKEKTNSYLKDHYPGIQDLSLLPHNQYVFVSASLGILGLLLFLLFTFYPWFYAGAFKDPLLSMAHIIFFSSFLVEHTLEAQIGTALYIFFLLLVLKYLHQSNKIHA